MPVVHKGGPCTECGADQSTAWYGRKGSPRFCKKYRCMRAYSKLRAEEQQALHLATPPATRKRPAEEVDFVPGNRISMIHACLGQR